MKLISAELTTWIDFGYGPEFQTIRSYRLFTTKDKAREHIDNLMSYLDDGKWIDEDTYSFQDNGEYSTKWEIKEVSVIE